MAAGHHITPSTAHRGPGATASILTWFLTVTVVLSVIARLGFRFSKLKLRARDDISLCFAAAFHIAQCIAVSVAADAGLGQHRSSLVDAQVLRFKKANYVADVFFVPTLCMAQMSAFFLVESIPASKTVQNVIRYMNVGNLTWSVVAILCVVFQSKPPEVWALPATSINMHIFWTIECVVAIIVELTLMFIPFWVIAPLQTSRAKRTTILVAFSFRIIVVVSLAARLAIMPSPADIEANSTRSLAAPVIVSQAVLCSAIVMTSIPVLSRFLDQFETGMLRIDENQGTGQGSSNPIESHRMSNLTSRTRVTAGKKLQFSTSVWEEDEEETLQPVTASNGNNTRRKISTSSDTKGILISRSWDCQCERSEEAGSDGERSAPVSQVSARI
ncbi:hypothetical protein D6D27_09751 [Aureobasidium pullulans]|nr:hypothetical protein D6D27_09751 [Aureobasidium pullulans]